MSEENVEIVRRQFELWNRAEWDAYARAYDPDVLVEAPEGWPEGSVTRGLEAWRQQAQRLRDTWDEARVEIEEIRPLGEDRVVARIRYLTRGAEPGISFDTPMAAAFSLRERKITRAQFFWNMQALEAAELSQ